MAHVEDVAAYILRQRGPMTAMKLQKLCYYAYGYHLAWESKPLFPERFEAWANGPVCRPLYAEHRRRFQLQAGDIQGDPGRLAENEAESINLVLEGLGHLTAHQLSTMTHSEAPWKCARERGGAKDLDWCSEELNDAEVEEFFHALTARDAEREG